MTPRTSKRKAEAALNEKSKKKREVCATCPGGPSTAQCMHTAAGQKFLSTQQTVATKPRSPRKVTARGRPPVVLQGLGIAPTAAQPVSSQPPAGFRFVQQGSYYQQQVQAPPGYTLVPNGWAGYPNQQGAPYGNPPAYGNHPGYAAPQDIPQMQMQMIPPHMVPPQSQDIPQIQMMSPPMVPPQSQDILQMQMMPPPDSQQLAGSQAPVIDPDLLTMSSPSGPIADPESGEGPAPEDAPGDNGDKSDNDSELDSQPAPSALSTPTHQRRAVGTQHSVSSVMEGKQRAVHVSATNSTHGFVKGALKGRNKYDIFRRKALPAELVSNPSRHFCVTFATIVDRIERLCAETGAYVAIGGTSRGVDSGVVSFVSNSFCQEAPQDATHLVNNFIKSVGAIKRARGTEALALTKDLMKTEEDRLELVRLAEAVRLRAADAESTVELQAQLIAELQARIAGASSNASTSSNATASHSS
ncbi:hypothetical protein C8R43DRAFT_1117403 [Mycena crocata]|nr:hypothetical protein C8R43DRAFT_1117403 [Mycena crocata]